MEFKDSERLIESFKRRPLRTIGVIIVLLIVLALIAFFNAFFGEKGKHAAGISTVPNIDQSSKDLPHHTKEASPRQTINQHTEGDQAPIVNVGPGGKSTINYGVSKDVGIKK